MSFAKTKAYQKKLNRKRIAIIDTGLAPEVAEKLQQQNIGKIQGWNFAADNSDLTDHHGHGSHVASLINKTAPNAELIILKYYDPGYQSIDSQDSFIAALEYAIKLNVDIINYSGGGNRPDIRESRLVSKASKMGILFVAASGNESRSNDLKPFYPASYQTSTMISVTATTEKKSLLHAANYGLHSVDIAAPGEQIPGLGLRAEPIEMTGTSQATAHVSGAAARLWEIYPDLTALDIKQMLLSSADYRLELRKTSKTAGLLNINRAQRNISRLRNIAGLRVLRQVSPNKIFLDTGLTNSKTN